MDAEQDPLQPRRCARKLAALATPERLRIVWFLRAGSRYVSEIAAMLQASPVNVTHHLGVLVAAGLLVRDKRGRYVHYALAPGVLLIDEDDSRLRLDFGCCRLEVSLAAEQAADDA